MEASNESQSNDLQFTFSYFNNLWSKDSITISLSDLHQRTVSPLWKPKTESYRKLKSNPKRDNEAKMTKDSMPVVIAEGTVRPRSTHAAANLSLMSGLAMYDLDHTDRRTAEIKELLRHLPYVAYAQTSISAEGLKVLVYLDVHTPAEYPLAYAICLQTLERILQHPCDPQCARITQPCSCVWDPEAYFNPAPQPYPWREELAADPSLTQLLPASVYTYSPSSTTGSGKSSPIPPATEACGYIAAFVRNFAQYHPWQKGNRHESMLALGRSARRKGFSKEELEKLTSVMTPDIVRDGYTLRELQKDLATGYQYVDLSYAPSSEEHSVSPVSSLTYNPQSLENTPLDEEDVLTNDEIIRASTPAIPDEIYLHLPPLVEEALQAAQNPYERDILLLGLLTNLSGCLPNVSFLYDQRPYSPHIYSLIIAPSAAGKSMFTLASKIPEAINNFLIEENKRKKKTYKRELRAWEESNKQQTKKNHSPASTEDSDMPEEPTYQYLCGAPSTSKSQIVKRLQSNADIGLIINSSELDTVSSSIKQDYGRFDDVFRTAFHHETIATDYKVDGQINYVEHPRLTLCFSGTPNQLPNFIRSMENGLYSRFIVFTRSAKWKFRSAAPRKGKENFHALFDRLSDEVLRMYHFLKQSPTEVTLTDKQWEEHTEYFSQLLNEVTSEKADAPGAIVLRSSLITVRIAAILTALRKCEGAMQMKEYICTDEDFHTAMEIVKTTVSHSLIIASSLPGETVKSQPLQPYFRIGPVINSLPKIFTYKEFVDKAVSLSIPKSSASRYLLKALESQFVDKQDNKYHRLKKFTSI